MSDEYEGERSQVANRILRSTLTVNDANIDFTPSLRRVRYDLEELNAAINKSVSGNTPYLIEVVKGIQNTGETANKLRPDIDNVLTEYSRLDQEFLKPYERLKRVHLAAQHLQAVAKLSRSLNWYLGMAKELEALTVKSQGKMDAAEESRNLYARAALLAKLQTLVQDTPHLHSLEVVREHEATIATAEQQLVRAATTMISDFTGGIDIIRNAVQSLCVFDTEQLLKTIDTWLKAQVGTTVLTLSRSIGTTLAFDTAWSFANDRIASVLQLSQVLAEKFLLTRVENKVGGNLKPVFWGSVAKNIRHKLHTMSVANPAQIKAMKAQGAHILAITEGVPEVHAVFSNYVNK